GARRARIPEELAEDLLAGPDRTARPLARDPAAAQRLVGGRGEPERLRERDAAAAMGRSRTFIEDKRLVACCGDIRLLVGRQRALAGLGHGGMLLPLEVRRREPCKLL